MDNSLEYLIRLAKAKEFTVKIKHKNISPEIVVTVDGKDHKAKVINNEIIWV